jgi:glycosyltransferase involved in cell wall biosynthesis
MRNTKQIAINILWLSHKDVTGGFIYARNLLDNLFEIDKHNKYIIFLNKSNFSYFKKRYEKYSNVSFTVIDIRRDIMLNNLRDISKFLSKIKKDDEKREEIIRREIQVYINKKNIDMLFFPSGIIYPKGLTNIKTISTIYDLQHEYYPENFFFFLVSFKRKEYEYMAQNSDYIIAISNYTKQSIVDKYNINLDKISVIYLDAIKLKENAYENEIKLPEEFIFYPAALWPHKNHKLLVEVLNDLKNKFQNLHIVFTGITKKKKLKEEIDILINKYNLSDKVLFLGFVSDETLNFIYKKAKILVFPSSFEGFGIPIIEAFINKLPVIAARNSSISEIVGDAGLLFETNNTEECRKCIERILTDRNLRENLIEKGLKRAQDFSWRKTAEQTLVVFENI